MKRAIAALLALALLLPLAACGGAAAGSRTAGPNSATVAQLLEDAVRESQAPAPTADPALQTPITPQPGDIDLSSPDADVDLTQLSGTMVYSQVSQMMYSPEEYVGKTVKMEGAFSIYEGEARNYYACIIADATACCANGIEFAWAGEHEYPGDYPAPGTDITVTGVFELYEEDGFLYSQLADAAVTF